MTPAQRIEQAKREVEQARKQLASTNGALQYRLKPRNLVNDAWDGVREKGGEIADGAARAVKDRPVVASGIAAAVVVFLARDSLWRLASGFLGRDEDAMETDTIEADLNDHETEYDLTAPTVKRSKKEGVKA